MNLSSLLLILITMPLTIFIVMPLAILACWLMYQPIKLLIPYPALEEAVGADLLSFSDVKAEKRSERRHPIEELRAKIADENGVYDGIVANISKAGICLKHLPERLSASTERLSVIIKGKTGGYCCFFSPSWETQDGIQGKVIGGKIYNTKQNWFEFVHSVQ